MFDTTSLRQKLYSPLGLMIVAGCLFLILWMVALMGLKMPGYAVIIDGENQGVVAQPGHFREALQEYLAENEETLGNQIAMTTDIRFARTFAHGSNIATPDECRQWLAQNMELKTDAAAILADGEPLVYVQCEETARQILAELEAAYTQVAPGEELIDVAFEEDVQIEEQQVPITRLMLAENALALIKNGTEQPQKYEVQEGDSLWLIARRNNLYVDNIMQANQLEHDRLSIGQELIIEKCEPFISVIATIEGEKKVEIPFETVMVTDRRVSGVMERQSGSKGEKLITYAAVKRNGIIAEQEIKEEKIIKAAVNRVVVRGGAVTQVASRSGSYSGSGQLDWPTYGSISSHFGSRGGTHTGLDIAARTGTPIRAADSGVVISSGWQGGYGLTVTIDHGNGMVTRYAHCNTTSVSAGQSVARGSTIATVGTTGNTTGPHLHFEVLINGSFRNPINYLR